MKNFFIEKNFLINLFHCLKICASKVQQNLLLVTGGVKFFREGARAPGSKEFFYCEKFLKKFFFSNIDCRLCASEVQQNVLLTTGFSPSFFEVRARALGGN